MSTRSQELSKRAAMIKEAFDRSTAERIGQVIGGGLGAVPGAAAGGVGGAAAGGPLMNAIGPSIGEKALITPVVTGAAGLAGGAAAGGYYGSKAGKKAGGALYDLVMRHLANKKKTPA